MRSLPYCSVLSSITWILLHSKTGFLTLICIQKCCNSVLEYIAIQCHYRCHLFTPSKEHYSIYNADEQSFVLIEIYKTCIQQWIKKIKAKAFRPASHFIPDNSFYFQDPIQNQALEWKKSENYLHSVKGITINIFMQISGGLLIMAGEEQRVSEYTIGINV